MNRERVYISSRQVIRRPGDQKLYRVTVTYETRQTTAAIHQYDDGTGYRTVNGEVVEDTPARYRDLDMLAELLTINNSVKAFYHNCQMLREWQAIVASRA